MYIKFFSLFLCSIFSLSASASMRCVDWQHFSDNIVCQRWLTSESKVANCTDLNHRSVRYLACGEWNKTFKCVDWQHTGTGDFDCKTWSNGVTCVEWRLRKACQRWSNGAFCIDWKNYGTRGMVCEQWSGNGFFR